MSGLQVDVEIPNASPTSVLASGIGLAETPSSDQSSSDCTQTESNIRNPEYDLNRPLQGWPELAKLIARKPDFEAFESFKDLRIKSLLYYQAELAQLRAGLHGQEWTEHRQGQFASAQDLGARLDTLHNCEKLYPERFTQIRRVREIRKVLKEYSTFTTLHTSLLVR